MFPVTLIFIEMLILMKTIGESVHQNQDVSNCFGLGVSLSVSSLVTTSPPRQLQMSWWNAINWMSGDQVILLQTSPTELQSQPLAIRAVTSPTGFVQTNIQASQIPNDKLGFSSHCLGYWVAYLRNATILVSNCLRTEPTWLNDHRDELKHLKLTQLLIPGTHDSAAYGTFTGDVRETIVIKYSITQEESIFSQLIHGVRYLDLRIGFYKRIKDKWWANHGVKRIHPLREIFQQIKRFMKNTSEIVILDLQEFYPGFGDDLVVHMDLVQYLDDELGLYMAFPNLTWDARLEDVWKSGRRLIVTYDNQKVVASSTHLWPAVEHRWGNVQTIERLHAHLSATITLKKMSGNKPWAAMAELTPTAWDVITDKYGGLRQMAHLVNTNVTAWMRGPWGAHVNVVAVDFFRGTGIVEEAIKWNRRNARAIRCT